MDELFEPWVRVIAGVHVSVDATLVVGVAELVEITVCVVVVCAAAVVTSYTVLVERLPKVAKMAAEMMTAATTIEAARVT